MNHAKSFVDRQGTKEIKQIKHRASQLVLSSVAVNEAGKGDGECHLGLSPDFKESSEP